MPHERKTLARNLGEFFGHIWQGVKADVVAPPPARSVEDGQARVVDRHRQESFERDERDGKIILRRTVVEEVELPKDREQ